MRYGPATLRALAEGAGFVRPELPVAVTIALAASGGHPHHDHVTGMSGCGRYVGLWGIDTDEWSDYVPEALYDPQAAAEAAYALTRRCDGFGWSAHWRAGADQAHRPAAVATMHQAPYRDREYVPVLSTLRAPRLAYLAERAAHRTVRHTQWRTTSR